MTKRLIKISKYRPSILQGTFEFSAGANHVSLSLEHPRERMLLRVLGITLAVLVFFYLYFVTASVLNVIARKEALARVGDIQGNIGSLEQRYLTLSEAANPQEGAALGLSPVEKTQYVYRTGNLSASGHAQADVETATIARNAN